MKRTVYLVTDGEYFVSTRRFNHVENSHATLTDFNHARLFYRKKDAEAAIEWKREYVVTATVTLDK